MNLRAADQAVYHDAAHPSAVILPSGVEAVVMDQRSERAMTRRRI